MPHNILPVTVMCNHTGYTGIRVNNTPSIFSPLKSIGKYNSQSLILKSVYRESVIKVQTNQFQSHSVTNIFVPVLYPL